MLRDVRLTPDLPPVWMLGAWALAWALARWLPVARFEDGGLGRWVLMAGLALIGWAAWQFWRRDTPIEPGTTPRALIREGPYRISRNPIYLGLSLVLTGLCMGLGAASALLPALAYPLVIDRRFVRAEEAALRGAFGAEAEAWLARTRRWI